jgi:hypothetical protein
MLAEWDMADSKENIDPGLEKARRGNQQTSGTGTRATHRTDEERREEDHTAEGIAGRRKSEERGG